MNLINRGVVVIKPKGPFLDWANRDLALSSPVTMEELRRDCTAILVPDLGSLEAALDYVEPLKPRLFEMELEAWDRDPTNWPKERTDASFDAWFELEVHSMVWDTGDTPIVKEEDEEPIEITGTWKVVSSPDFDDDYLYMVTRPTVTLRQQDTDVSGDFHVGLIVGSLDGRLDGDRVLFSFEAMDEMDPISGAGTITLQDDRLVFRLLIHFGDEFTFECVPEENVE
jgi:hypothetical protein